MSKAHFELNELLELGETGIFDLQSNLKSNTVFSAGYKLDFSKQDLTAAETIKCHITKIQVCLKKDIGKFTIRPIPNSITLVIRLLRTAS